MKELKWFLLGIVAIFFVIIILVIDSSKEEKKESENMSGKIAAIIKVKDFGNIELELDSDMAPITVKNFVDLAEDKFYDNLTFHRIIDGFMIQGGAPNHDVNGGSGKTIKGEFKSNGVENNISHVRGVISMARSNLKDSASSQFFIVQEDSLHLDGDYAAFGHVTKGMEVVDRIAKSVTPIDANGSIKYEEQPIIETIEIIR